MRTFLTISNASKITQCYLTNLIKGQMHTHHRIADNNITISVLFQYFNPFYLTAHQRDSDAGAAVHGGGHGTDAAVAAPEVGLDAGRG